MNYKEAIKKSLKVGGYIGHGLLSSIYATTLAKQMELDDTLVQYRVARKLCGMATNTKCEVIQSQQNLAKGIRETHMFSTILKDGWYPCDENGDIVFLDDKEHK